MGAKLKVCPDCGVKKRIGRTHTRCKSCRQSHQGYQAAQELRSILQPHPWFRWASYDELANAVCVVIDTQTDYQYARNAIPEKCQGVRVTLIEPIEPYLGESGG